MSGTENGRSMKNNGKAVEHKKSDKKEKSGERESKRERGEREMPFYL